jgi:uncharacterized protein (DUF433 family)
MKPESLITCDPKTLGGTPVFKGARVPVRTLFDYLSDDLSLEYFLESFPSVNREQATSVLRLGQERIEREVVAWGFFSTNRFPFRSATRWAVIKYRPPSSWAGEASVMAICSIAPKSQRSGVHSTGIWPRPYRAASTQ